MALTPDELRKLNDERFFRRLSPIKGLECWMWVSTVFKRRRKKLNDYVIPWFWVRFRVGKKQVYARRYAWEMMNGTIRENIDIVNVCGNDRCVRPDPAHNIARRALGWDFPTAPGVYPGGVSPADPKEVRSKTPKSEKEFLDD